MLEASDGRPTRLCPAQPRIGNYSTTDRTNELEAKARPFEATRVIDGRGCRVEVSRVGSRHYIHQYLKLLSLEFCTPLYCTWRLSANRATENVFTFNRFNQLRSNVAMQYARLHQSSPTVRLLYMDIYVHLYAFELCVLCNDAVRIVMQKSTKDALWVLNERIQLRYQENYNLYVSENAFHSKNGFNKLTRYSQQHAAWVISHWPTWPTQITFFPNPLPSIAFTQHWIQYHWM